MYLAGETNPEQDERLAVLLKQEPQAFRMVEKEMQAAWVGEALVDDESSEVDESLQKIWEKINLDEQHAKSSRQRMSYRLLSYAASIIVLLSIGLFLYWRSHPSLETVTETKWVTRSTGAGEKVKLLLPDSSVVFLNAMSQIRYMEDIDKAKSRDIYLEGQAFFEVKNRINQPFTVHTETLQTTVLGTSFDLSAYPTDEKIKVGVKTGKVKVSKLNGNMLEELSQLMPGMQLVYQKTSSEALVQKGRREDVDGWKDNRFAFRNEPLKDIVKALARTYKTKIIIENRSLDSCMFNASFNNKNIQQIMDQLHVMSAGKITYTISNKRDLIKVKGRGCE